MDQQQVHLIVEFNAPVTPQENRALNIVVPELEFNKKAKQRKYQGTKAAANWNKRMLTERPWAELKEDEFGALRTNIAIHMFGNWENFVEVLNTACDKITSTEII